MRPDFRLPGPFPPYYPGSRMTTPTDPPSSTHPTIPASRAKGCRFAAALLGVACLMLLAPPAPTALAQLVGTLPDSIVQSDFPLSAADKAQILEYVKRHAPALTGSPDEIIQARKALVRPTRSSRVGTAFRVEYADFLTVNPDGAKLRELLRSPNEQTAINAAYILGEVGAKPSLDALSAAIKDRDPNRPAVRLTAALGIARTFDAVRAPGQSALSRNDALRALADLESAFRTEPNADVADALVAAFDSATRIPEDKLPGIRNEAAQRLCSSVQARVKDPNAAGFHRAYARAAKALFDGVINENVNTALSPQAIVQAGGTAGDLVALALRQAGGSAADGPPPSELCQIVRAAETLAAYAVRKAAGSPMGALNLDQSLCGAPSPGGDRPATPADIEKFKRDAARLIGPDGLLCKPPFAFSADRFR
ncbi:MAG: HEAT repeat domain-containing protein [Phycisphaerales bacterium]